ncbi:signal peptidase I [Eubacterium xylanophilum]|uniref:signal peptidase I n=1 Tax=Eubacterium xylanophilum TaxID=39497 RepID=UPI00047E293E|nr:signal peptidase I [Eubacterium xylanophilum]
MEKQETKQPKGGNAKKKASITFIISVFLVVLTLVLCVLAFVLTQNLKRGKPTMIAGHCLMRIATGSMEPTLHVDDFIYITKVDASTLKAGDIIVYKSQEESTDGALITHRIVEVKADGTFSTKGDANTAVDSENVQPSQVIGRFEKKSRIFLWLSGFGDFRKLAILSIMIVILVIAMHETRTIMRLGKQVREERSYEERMRLAIEEEKKRLAEEDR